MIEFVRRQLIRIPIRVRLTLWYVLLMGLTFLLLSLYLMWQFRRSLLSSVDTALEVAVSQALSSMDNENGRLAFQETNGTAGFSQQLQQRGFAMRLTSPDGEVWDGLGAYPEITAWGPSLPGYHTQGAPADDAQWRVYSQPLLNADRQVVGWLQAAQSLEEANSTLQNLRDQLLLGIPLVLLLAGSGGYFLARRALRPIDRITRTAQSTEASDLSRRIDYHGPPDEVGRLARTFDQMVARLQAAFERERRFTADAAHELRTPLSILKGKLEVTLSRSRSPRTYRAALEELSQQVERLIRLSNELLILSRLEVEKHTWVWVPVDLADLLESILEQIQPIAGQNQLHLDVDLQPPLSVVGDLDQLTSLFLNLVDNAVKYTPPGGEVSVHGWADGDRVWVKIQNTGPGIAAEHLSHLFEPFYRADASRSRHSGGAGLGLAIAQEIAQGHGGMIEAESHPGQGVTFTTVLPCNRPSTETREKR